MRAFIAIDIPQDLKDKFSQIQENLKKSDLEFKWVKPENLHLTLKFLGYIDEQQLPEIIKVIEEIVYGQKSFKLRFESFGFFPDPRRPRVFFVGTNNQDLLKAMVQQLEIKLEKIGFPVESLPAGRQGRFQSHLTLARIKSRKNLETLLKNLEKIKLEGDFAVKEIILYESILKPTGPLYEKITSISLAE